MQIGVLGRFTASVGGGSILPRAMQPQQVLALLALRANDPVPVTTICRELWGDTPPATAVTVVQNYVAALRKSIAGHLGGRDAAHDLLSTGRGGYSLRLGPDGLDSTRFERWAREGSRALAQKQAASAAEALQQALAMWRGPVLCGVDAGPALAAEVVRLDTLHLLAVEQHLDASLRLGRHYELLGELGALVAHHPLAERLHQLYMVALHRTGRRAEALAVYECLRRNLDEQLGLTPSPSMQRARHAVVHAADLRAEDAPEIEAVLIEQAPAPELIRVLGASGAAVPQPSVSLVRPRT
jgi:DNA-binding SARP family transcriptional activator